MKSAKGTMNRALNCPSIILLAALFGFLYSYIDYINPLTGLIMSFFTLGGDLLGTIISAISVILSPRILGKGLLISIIVLLIGSFVIGFFMSGYMGILKRSVIDGIKDNKAFQNGVKESFGRSIRGTFILIVTLIIMLLVVIVASIPSLSTLWSALNGKSEMLPLALFLSVLSVTAIFFALLFYNVYVVFWYPAITLGYTDFISSSKRIIDDYFFEVAWRILGFSMELILITLLSIFTRYFLMGISSNSIIFAGVVLVEGILVSIWFLGMTSYTCSVFDILERNYKTVS